MAGVADLSGALSKPSGLFLIAANLIPLAGVLFFGWDVATIIVLYWLEGVIIGGINIIKILTCRKLGDNIWISALINLFTAAFFTVHYGMFTFIHGTFVATLFKAETLMAGILDGGPLMWAGLSFLISHLFSLLVNFFGRQEYLYRTAQEQMMRPYGRVIVMHMVIILGGGLLMLFGGPIAALMLLIALKIALDLYAHQKDHDKAAKFQL